eukprot:tig00020554_g10877.t2
MQGQPSVPQFQNPLAGLLSNVPKLTQYLAAALGVGYLLSWIPGTVQLLALVPIRTIGSYFIWNLVTSGFFCTTLLTALFSILGVVFAGKYLEPVWGSKEFLKFIFVVNILTAFATFMSAIALYALSGGAKELVLIFPTSGFYGALSAFTVAVKQLVPNHEISFLFAFKFKAKAVPVLWILVSVLFWMLGAGGADLPWIVFGTIFGWVYLRFFQEKPDGSRGDASSTFSFASFFPDVLAPVVTPVSNIFFLLCCRCWTGSAVHQSLGLGQPTHFRAAPAGGSALGGNPQDAERRRQRALALLNSLERPQAGAPGEQPSGGSNV